MFVGCFGTAKHNGQPQKYVSVYSSHPSSFPERDPELRQHLQGSPAGELHEHRAMDNGRRANTWSQYGLRALGIGQRAMGNGRATGNGHGAAGNGRATCNVDQATGTGPI